MGRNFSQTGAWLKVDRDVRSCGSPLEGGFHPARKAAAAGTKPALQPTWCWDSTVRPCPHLCHGNGCRIGTGLYGCLMFLWSTGSKLHPPYPHLSVCSQTCYMGDDISEYFQPLHAGTFYEFYHWIFYLSFPHSIFSWLSYLPRDRFCIIQAEIPALEHSVKYLSTL